MNSINNFTEKTILTNGKGATKPPKQILDNIWAFPPNRDILGGTAYFIMSHEGNILIDCPAYHEDNLQFLQQQGGVKYLFLTNRDGISKYIKQITQALNCQLVIQEQELYLLPGRRAHSFEAQYQLTSECELIWTCGYSPGSSCLYYQPLGGILFSGRHLLPNKNGKPAPLLLKKTFHWRRQLRHSELIYQRLEKSGLKYICPGANTGLLRGQGYFPVTEKVES